MGQLDICQNENLPRNDHQRKDVKIETNSSNHDQGMETGIMGSSFSK